MSLNFESYCCCTGPLYAAIDPDDQYHQRSQRELERLSQEKLAVIVPYSVYLETHKLVLQWLGIRQAIAFADDLRFKANLLNPLPEDYQAAVKLIIRFLDQQITLFDAVTAVLAAQMNVSVWTYDYHFDVMQVSVWR